MIEQQYDDFQEIALYYDELYVKSEEYQREVQQITAFCRQYQQSPGNKLLDVACGTGGHIAYLKDQYQVTGLDLSDDMLNIAQKKFPDITFTHGNMINFSLNVKFDIIICLYGSIGFVKTISNLNQAVRTMRNHLLPGGIIILVPWSTTETFKEAIVADAVNNSNLKLARMENVTLEENNLVKVVFHHLIGKDGDVRYLTKNMEIGLFSKDEYLNAISEAGLQLMEYYTGRAIRMGAFIGRLPKRG